ncbi:hypothetical protein WDW89_18320 [Deltaproteobacteria bacterium TL4]
MKTNDIAETLKTIQVDLDKSEDPNGNRSISKIVDLKNRKTKEKKQRLLTVLKYPMLPLHNNISENSARVQKRREDVSLQRKNAEEYELRTL